MTPSFYPPEVKKLVDAVLHGTAQCSPQLRQDVAAYAAASAGSGHTPDDLPESLRPYLDKLNRYAYKITDKDVARLRDAGFSDEALFELTVCAALGSGLARLEKTIALLNGAAS